MLDQHKAPIKDQEPDAIVSHFPNLRVVDPCWAEPYGVRYNGEWEA